MTINCDYRIRDDIGFILEAEKLTVSELSERTGVSRSTLNEIEKTGKARDDVCEKIYAYAYEKKYRINSVKEELTKEKYGDVLFHGSKTGLNEIKANGSRDNCDFGKGFYLGETYFQALSFVCEKPGSSIYEFRYSPEDLRVKKFECDLEWMLAVCFYRGSLGEYASDNRIRRLVEQIEAADVIIAPIADNKMFYIMTQFAEGEINADVAVHSLSASNLGMQYVFKSEKSLENLMPIERYYVSNPEREDCKRQLIERGFGIDTKLKLAKREFKAGLYVDEILRKEITDERVRS